MMGIAQPLNEHSCALPQATHVAKLVFFCQSTTAECGFLGRKQRVFTGQQAKIRKNESIRRKNKATVW